MAGTNHSTGGFRRITRRLVPPVKMRLFGFILTVLSGTLILAWITHSLWTQLDQLQTDHAAVRSEGFYLGVHLRSTLRGLNENLLQFSTSRDPAFREAFLNDAGELKQWIATNRVLLAETANLQLLKGVEVSQQLLKLKKLENLYSAYLTNAAVILGETNSAVTARSLRMPTSMYVPFRAGFSHCVMIWLRHNDTDSVNFCMELRKRSWLISAC